MIDLKAQYNELLDLVLAWEYLVVVLGTAAVVEVAKRATANGWFATNRVASEIRRRTLSVLPAALGATLCLLAPIFPDEVPGSLAGLLGVLGGALSSTVYDVIKDNLGGWLKRLFGPKDKTE